MSKKILSIALAVVMLFSVLACTAGAANTTVTTIFPGEAQGGYRVVSDAYVGMPAGETVNVKVYFVLPSYDYNISFTGNTVLAFTDAFEYVADSRVWGDSYSYMKATTVNTSTAYSASSNQFNAADTARGWTNAIMVQKTLDTTAGSGLSSTTGHPVDPACELYSIQFKTTRTLTASDSIGIPSGCAAKMVAFKVGSTTYKAENIILDEAVAVADIVEVNETATAKMRPGAVAGTVDLGLTGAVNALSFEAGKASVGGVLVAPNLNAVGVQARVNGVVVAAESTCIYETADGFKYRAAITGIDAAGLGAQIEVRTYITDANSNTYFSNWMYIDATAVHDNAVAGGMAGIA